MASRYDGKTNDGIHWTYKRRRGQIRRDAKGRPLKSYTWRYRNAEGKSAQATDDSLDGIRAQRDEIRAALRNGTYLDPKRGKVLVKVYARQWLKAMTPSLSERSVEQYDGHLRNHIIPKLGHLRLNRLDGDALQDFVTYLSGDDRSNATVQAVWKTLSSIIRDAHAKGRITRDPRAGVTVPKADKKRGYPLDWTTLEAIEAAMIDRFRIIATLAAETGMRESELAGLCEDQIDLDAETITVDRQLSRPKNHGDQIVLKDLKTVKGVRTLPLSKVACTALKASLGDHPTTTRTMAWVHRDRSRENVSVRLLFTYSDGRPVTSRDIQREWDKARTKSGQRTDVHGSTNFHRLRHTYACELINGGLDAKAVMTMLGHANITTTYDTYGYMLDRTRDHVRAVVNAMRTRPRRTLRAVA